MHGGPTVASRHKAAAAPVRRLCCTSIQPRGMLSSLPRRPGQVDVTALDVTPAGAFDSRCIGGCLGNRKDGSRPPRKLVLKSGAACFDIAEHQLRQLAATSIATIKQAAGPEDLTPYQALADAYLELLRGVVEMAEFFGAAHKEFSRRASAISPGRPKLKKKPSSRSMLQTSLMEFSLPSGKSGRQRHIPIADADLMERIDALIAGGVAKTTKGACEQIAGAHLRSAGKVSIGRPLQRATSTLQKRASAIRSSGSR